MFTAIVVLSILLALAVISLIFLVMFIYDISNDIHSKQEKINELEKEKTFLLSELNAIKR